MKDKTKTLNDLTAKFKKLEKLNQSDQGLIRYLKRTKLPFVPMPIVKELAERLTARTTKLEEIFLLYQQTVAADVKRTMQADTFKMFNEEAGQRSKIKRDLRFDDFKKLVKKGAIKIDQSYKKNELRLKSVFVLGKFISEKTFYNYKNLLKKESTES